MQILFILLPKSKKTRLLSIEVTENTRRGSSYSILFWWFNQRWGTWKKKKKSLFGQTEQAAEEKNQASRNLAFFSHPSVLVLTTVLSLFNGTSSCWSLSAMILLLQISSVKWLEANWNSLGKKKVNAFSGGIYT